MRKPTVELSEFKKRRQEVLSRMKANSLAILPAHPDYVRNNDVHHPYRQDSNLYYLTAFEEPSCVLILRPGIEPEEILYVLPKDPLRETWEGFLYGPEGAKKEFSMDEARSVEIFEKDLLDLLSQADHVYYTLFNNKEMDEQILKAIKAHAQKRSRTNRGHVSIEDLRPLMGELRLKKSDYELKELRKACEIGSKAHVEMMKACRPGYSERGLHGVFLKSIMEQGASNQGYGTIIASGDNAVTLHYVFNDQELKSGDLILIDAGAEYNFYTSDITRTYPVNGKFTQDQKRVYNKVLDLQKQIISWVKPGETREGLQKKTISGLVDIMLSEGLLRGSKEEIIEKKEYLKYYMHGVGHWLGLDVHDMGVTEFNGEPRPLEAGMVMTIEPGLYIRPDESDAPEALRGMGIRIEDNVLVTEVGSENLTEMCPKEVSELEDLIGKA